MTAISITAVMPAFRAAHLLPRVLPPLIAMQQAGDLCEVLVVDDCSPDDTAAVARAMGARVLVTPANGGPGVARNLAAEVARGDVLWFVDSDVIAAPGGAARIAAAFADPAVAAVFGSYDNAPEGSWFSRYKNLLHRFHHQHARRNATTFWAGCGAVRKSAFRAIGGFDVETYRVPSIEDIELGYRLKRDGGLILVDPLLEGKHLKQWTIRNAIFTDIFRRALPWSRLMIAREGLTDDLNTGMAERLRAVIAGLWLLSILALVLRTALWPALWPAIWPWTLAATALALVVNLRFAAFLWRNGGPAVAIGAMIYHQFYYIYAAGAYVWCLFEYHVLGRRNRLHVP